MNNSFALLRGKKGIALWISWMLLMSFALVLSALMYDWIFGFTQDNTQELERRTFEAEGCEDTGIIVTDICQDTQTLYMNVTNVKNLKIKKIVFRVYDLYDNPETVSKNITIRPGRTEPVQILKQGRSSVVEVIPVTRKGSIEVTCTDKLVAYEEILSC